MIINTINYYEISALDHYIDNKKIFNIFSGQDWVLALLEGKRDCKPVFYTIMNHERYSSLWISQEAGRSSWGQQRGLQKPLKKRLRRKRFERKKKYLVFFLKAWFSVFA